MAQDSFTPVCFGQDDSIKKFLFYLRVFAESCVLKRVASDRKWITKRQVYYEKRSEERRVGKECRL